MQQYNEELVKAGVMLAGEGLHPSDKGARVRFSGDKRTVVDGPFTETKELVAGFWLFDVKSKEEAIEWVKRCPNPMDEDSEIEIRQVFEIDDFDPSPPRYARRTSAFVSRRPETSSRGAVPESETDRAIEAVWRIESARLIGGLARIVRDVGLAEDLAHDALVAALEQWPESGVPDNPGAWLMATAKHRAIDRLRRGEVLERKQEELGRELQIRQALAAADWDAAIDDVGDDVLRLIFTTCHPVLSREARVALTLRLLGGLTTPEIARAFLVSEATVAQRIVRAKRTLAETRVPFEVPARDELAERLSSVLEVVYFIFNEGYSATAGDDWIRPHLTHEALRLGRILAALAPRRARGARPRRADGDPGIAQPCAGRPVGRADPAAWTRTARAGTTCSWAAASRRSSGPSGSAGGSGRTRCRRRSPPATPAPALRRTPTGRASSPSTTRSPSWRRPRWST